ncbi:orotate phosphoribosyltransferase [Porphyromonas crevioricanis]|uniref:Orotate phosphoribosyltransferase n=2 Tax=Porphyromonas crevioricanis TaxID=393921 RepID=A0AB34PI28_9PORP|nr:orotate phosphoribosyltransferase [Porphyromonas crevioricanis]KGN90822.1 orotate phosphoribosyltransferase [Porphyromonas crevioricanis]KGN94988.1 orotate phosphoribosyltransferase [Porphyromonas crevioricanis]GAD05291.1 orotate phosphoribosyltransferase [Porphyromonas crevioricanis JCM 15906]SJZ52412.1 orotate phosphoribosyltransferase [Porphyromonas crevioricanis]
MDQIARLVASKLLEVEAVRLQPDKPFLWASGWHSPIYCDNRKTLSYPDVRSTVRDELAAVVTRLYPQTEYIAGVATGAIAQGALVADKLGLPFVYVRSKAKDHGMENLIEGDLKPNSRVVVVEDLISTGGSSLKAVEALRAAGAEVLGMVAIYTHGFDEPVRRFAEAEVKLTTLTDYDTVIAQALASGYVGQADVDMLAQWRKDPASWNPAVK